MRYKFMDWIRLGKWKKVLAFLLFCFLSAGIFLKITYLFRNTGYDRLHIVGFQEEKQVDMVYIGGSAAFVYWQPPRAWAEYGITSYDYATNTIQAETIQGEIKEILKTERPELFVVGLRAFQYWSEEGDEGGFRNVTDSMDYSRNRFETVHRYLDNREAEDNADALSYYFDIAKYHTNTAALASSANWQLSDNRGSSPYNGWEFISLHESLDTPTDFLTEERGELAEGSRKTLVELLEFCQDEKLNVLFVVCPYWITKEHQMLYNSMQDLIESYGFGYLNANEYYQEMGLDFSKDVYNTNHVNPYGAEKYTRFLAQYIQEHYHLANHNGEDGMEDWDAMYDEFSQKDNETKSAIDNIIANKEEAYQNGLHLKEIENPYVWCEKSDNANYTMLFAAKGKGIEAGSLAADLLSTWKITADDTEDIIAVYNNTGEVYFSADTMEENYTNTFIGHSDKNAQYELNSGTSCTILIDGAEYAPKKDGLNIVIYDNNEREVLDSVVIRQDAEGNPVLLR